MNFTELKDFSRKDIESLIERAIELKKTKKYPKLNNVMVCNLFLEPSTRTKMSFEVAEKRCEMQVFNLEAANSSFLKNETLYDTILNLKQMDVTNFVIRSKEEKYFDKLKTISDIKIINAGDGTNSHPSQSLLDLMTIKEHFGKLENLTVLIVGDLKHSRVFHTNAEAMSKLGMKLLVSCPNEFRDKDTSKLQNIDLEEGLKRADVVMLLRVQHERHENKFQNADYNKKYGLNKDNVKLLKDSAIILHPGPVNHGWEIEEGLAFSGKSKILNQVENGVFCRVAIIEKVNS